MGEGVGWVGVVGVGGGGQNSSGCHRVYRYVRHLYCLAVQAGFYSEVVECRTLSPADRVRSPVGEKCYFHFFTCYIWRPP